MLAALFARRTVGVPGAAKPAIRNRWHTSDSTSIPEPMNDSLFKYYGREVQRVRDIDGRRLSACIEKNIKNMQAYLRADQNPKNSALVDELRRNELAHEFLMKPVFEVSDEYEKMQKFHTVYEEESARRDIMAFGAVTALGVAPFCGHDIGWIVAIWGVGVMILAYGSAGTLLYCGKPDATKLDLYKNLLHDSRSFNSKPDDNLRKLILHLYGVYVK